jgi:hypothetical protein
MVKMGRIVKENSSFHGRASPIIDSKKQFNNFTNTKEFWTAVKELKRSSRSFIHHLRLRCLVALCDLMPVLLV